MASVNQVNLVGNIGRDERFTYMHDVMHSMVPHTPLNISNDMPESGGGEASTGITDGPDLPASDDDDSGDGDGEPARRSPHKNPHPSFAPALFSFAPLSHYTSFGRSRIYQLIADPVLKFPPPIKIGKSSRWLKTEVDNWLVKQADSRQQVPG